jgi:hypothetical protein
MFVLGLILFVVAVVVDVAAVATNQGAGAMLTSHFTLFGWSVPLSSGWLFFWSIITGLIGMLGLTMMFMAVHQARHQRRELRRARCEANDVCKRGPGRVQSERAESSAPGPVPEQRARADHPARLRERLGLRRANR